MTKGAPLTRFILGALAATIFWVIGAALFVMAAEPARISEFQIVSQKGDVVVARASLSGWPLARVRATQ